MKKDNFIIDQIDRRVVVEYMKISYRHESWFTHATCNFSGTYD